MPIFLEGMAIQFFRGIGGNVQKMAPFKSFNFFVGANNVGKSTALDCLHRYLKGVPGQLESSDEHRGEVSGQFSMALAISTKRFIENVSAQIPSQKAGVVPDVEAIIRELLADGEFVWVKRAKLGSQHVKLSYLDVPNPAGAKAIADGLWQRVWRALTNQEVGGFTMFSRNPVIVPVACRTGRRRAGLHFCRR